MQGDGKGDRHIGRRTVLAGGAGLAVAGTTRLGAGTPPPGHPAPSIRQEVVVDELTNVAVTASPDGAHIAFDLLGVLWRIPASGGDAVRLTDDYGDIALPHWSPDGSRIVFQAYRDGNFHIASVAPDGSAPIQHTQGSFDHREPSFSPDGLRIAFSSDRTGRYAIHILDLKSGEITPLTGGAAQESEPSWSRDGSSVLYIADGLRIEQAAPGTPPQILKQIEPASDFFRGRSLKAPVFAPDGRLVHALIDDLSVGLFAGDVRISEQEDAYPFRPAWLAGGDMIYAARGKLWRKGGGAAREIAFRAKVSVATPSYRKKRRDHDDIARRPVVGIGSPQLSPDARRIAFRALNDIWILPIGGKPERVTSDGFYKCDPAWSPDGRWLSYSSDRGGTLDIWLRDLASGAERQLTRFPGAAVSGSWSNDSRHIAFLDQDGALHEVELSSGAVRKLFTAIWEPGRPSWGPEGRHIVMAAFKPSSARFREGHSEILSIDRVTGAAAYTPVAPFRSIATRGDDGPAWSPDGRYIAYVLASMLWIAPVDATGALTGAPRRITSEVSDAPSWSGDSRSLLYLSNGRLRLVSVAGGVPRTIPCPLRWARARPADRKVLRAARLWDGTRDAYRENVDLVIERNRIAAVLPAGRGPLSDANARLFDAGARTIMPGLIDMHTHRQMQGYGYGDRQGRIWLAFGVTTTRSPGSPAYHMVEDREAIESGARIAPRHYATGEAIDGTRIFYNFMRPVTEPGQLALELSRADALDYDLIKTYVRLPHDVQRAVIGEAHKRGMHVTSHYHYPALAHGIDSMEHLGATSRLGYSRTHTATGGGYQDVNALFAKAHAPRTPTFFYSHILLADDRSLVDDRRVATLYPPWELKKLRARAATVSVGDHRPMLDALEREVQQIKDTIAAGGHVIAGTDAPIDFVAISLHLQLRALTRFGVSPYQALLTATRHAGAFLDEPIGTATPGALADLIVVDGDPLADVAAAAAVHNVILNGEVHEVDSLLAPFAGRSSRVEQPAPLLATADAGHWWHDPAYVEECRAACCAGPTCSHGHARGLA